MPDQQVMWTVLPRGADNSHLHLDVFVSPRLGVNAPVDSYTLADFPEFAHWTKTLEQHLAFEVELADGSRHPAEVTATALDHDAWDHLFPGTTFVRPWSFKDLSDTPIYSFPFRFVTAYLRDLYRDVGRNYPAQPPSRADLDGLRGDLGPLTDVRVGAEREPPPRDDNNLPLPQEQPPPGPQKSGCLGGFGALLWHLFLVWLRKLLHLPPSLPAPPPDPTPPPAPIPRVVHPSPYGDKPPLVPVVPPPEAALEAAMASDKVIHPDAPHGTMAAALAARAATFDFMRVQRFYDRPESRTPPASRPVPPKLDFHQAVGALGDYPAILRSLGLVVRLRVPRPTADPRSIRVLAKWDGELRSVDIAPRTNCTLANTRFVAAGRPAGGRPPSELAGGMLDLADAGDRLVTDTPKFDIVQVDADGAALKAILAAATLERRRQLFVEKLLGIDLPDEEATPALRSGGLAIARPERAFYVHDRLQAAAVLVQPQPAPQPDAPSVLADDLFAEDLLRGYTIEVSESGGEWRSLCWRVGGYELVDDAGAVVRRLPTVTDEGYVKSASASSAEGDGNPLYVHDALARWSGWSLTVPRPGRALHNHLDGPPPADGHYEHPDWPHSDPQGDYRLRVTFEPKPGSLPRLRFGHAYRMRARARDLAGGLLAPPSPAEVASDAVTYRRFEPAAPPTPLPLREFWPGESLERIVLRSDFDRDSGTYANDAFGAGAGDARAHASRHLFPPKSAQQMAELHGRLDMGFGATGHPDAAYRISLREAGSFANAKLVDVHTVDVDHPEATVPFGQPGAVEIHATPSGAADPAPTQSYLINRHDGTLRTPYLPDPLVAGIALRGVPGLVDHVDEDPLTVVQVQTGDGGGTEPLLQIPYSGSWPDYESVRLRVKEKTGGEAAAPTWDAGPRVLTIHLAKGETARIRYSSFVSAPGLDAHGIWDWIDDGNPGGPLRAQALHGAHWMISPPRVLAIVHAVQRPLQTAYFPSLDTALRQVGETTAQLEGQLHLDVATTSRIDVEGSWTEWLDDPDDGVAKEPRTAVAFDLAVPGPDAASPWTDDIAFPPPAAPGHEPRTRHEFGDTRHRWVDYRIRATTRFREYLPPGLPGLDLSRLSEDAQVAHVNVRSSARPDTPRTLYTVPTFGWPTAIPAAGWPTLEHERTGGGLRIYADRPWYSSGEGELLGIVMTANEPRTLPDHLCSRYGLDLTAAGTPGAATVGLEPHHFPNRTAEKAGIVLAEDDALSSTVAGFAPRWDVTRKLWYFDIELAVEALPWNSWPFLRLALCRYQPDAIPSAKISKIVLADFAQVAPDRHLSLSWNGDTQVRAVLHGRAPVWPTAPRAAFRVQKTTVPPGIDADELDWEHDSGPAPVVDAAVFDTLIEPTDADGDGDVEWEAAVDLPAPRNSRRMRLEVAEYERLNTDEEIHNGAVTRITYVAHIPLD
jgi:hypothetical protein